MRGIAFVSANAVLVRKSRRTFGAHKPKAPSGRELPTKSGEGERVTVKFNQISKSRRLLPSRFACHLPLGGRLSPVRICLQTEKNEIVLCTISSERGSDEIFGVPPQMKSKPYGVG